jgi:hypothetical protein
METLIQAGLALVIVAGCVWTVRTWIDAAERRGYERGKGERS